MSVWYSCWYDDSPDVDEEDEDEDEEPLELDVAPEDEPDDALAVEEAEPPFRPVGSDDG